MTKPQSYAPIEVALKNLRVHPANVRARTAEAYSEAGVAALAANIREMGLLQPLLVQATGKSSFGVLAGGRRLAALMSLASDKTAKGFGPGMKVACRRVPDDTPVSAALSLSENELQVPMDAIDRYEAFAALRDQDGLDLADIARVFGLPERTVRETLRIGLVHGDIRAAHRAGEIALETVKAFAGHPDPAVQLEVFEALSGEGQRVEAWTVRRALESRGVRQGDALGAFVREAYRAAGGAVAPDLIEEDSLLTDPGLVQKILVQHLDDLAEEARAVHGFAWAEHRIDPDWESLSAYGRVHRAPVEIDAATQEVVDEMTARLDALAAAHEATEDWEEEGRLSDAHDALTGEIEALTMRYGEADLAIGGVMAIWRFGRVEMLTGLVRPEDMPDRAGSQALSAEEIVGPKISAKLAGDLARTRTRAVGLALAQDPATARVYGDWLLIGNVARDLVLSAAQSSLRFSPATFGPAEPEEGDALEEQIAAHAAALPFDWVDDDDGKAYERFAALEAETRDQLVAWAVSRTLEPVAGDAVRPGARAVVEATVLPDIRALWTPDADVFSRLAKPDLLRILRDDLGLGQKADALVKAKKSVIVEKLCALFSAPDGTLSADAREKIARWCPPGMATVVPQSTAAPGSGGSGEQPDSDIAIDVAA